MENNIKTNITGNEQEDLQSLITRAVQEAGLNKGEEPKQAEPLKLNLGGQELSFSSLEELQRSLDSTLREYNTTLATLQAQVPKEKPKKQAKEETFSQERFAELLEKDVLGGFKYALGFALPQVDSFSNTQKAALEAYQHTQQLNQRSAADQFREQYPQAREWLDSSPENVQKFIGIMQEMGAPATVHGFQAAFGLGTLRGDIKLGEAGQGQQNFNYQQVRPQAPPTMGGRGVTSGGLSEDQVLNFANLPPEKRRAILQRMEQGA